MGKRPTGSQPLPHLPSLTYAALSLGQPLGCLWQRPPPTGSRTLLCAPFDGPEAGPATRYTLGRPPCPPPPPREGPSLLPVGPLALTAALPESRPCFPANSEFTPHPQCLLLPWLGPLPSPSPLTTPTPNKGLDQTGAHRHLLCGMGCMCSQTVMG